MIVDLLGLINNRENKVKIDNDINFSSDPVNSTTIRSLENIHFSGSIVKLIDDTFELTGKLTGTMILPDDITLEDYKYDFTSEIEENFDETSINLQKSIDITDILWQNILVEIPLRAVNPKNENIKLEGDGWRLISEEEVKNENNPLSSLGDLFKEGVEEDGSSI